MDVKSNKDISFFMFDNTFFFRVLFLFPQRKRGNRVGVTDWYQNIEGVLRFFDDVNIGNDLFCLT